MAVHRFLQSLRHIDETELVSATLRLGRRSLHRVPGSAAGASQG